MSNCPDGRLLNIKRQFEIYDRLPSAVRLALQSANHSYTASQAAAMVKVRGEQWVIKAIAATDARLEREMRSEMEAWARG